MTEITAIIDRNTGSLVLEGLDVAGADAVLGDAYDDATELNCGKPIAGIVEDASIRATGARSATTVRIARVYTGSLVDGPGRRSVAQLQGCPIRCVGCYVPFTHAADGGIEADIDAVIEALCADTARDGVTLMGGEPTAQPDALLEIVECLALLGEHTVLYTGFTVENLKRRRDARLDRVLSLVDIVIDGPYVAKLAHAGLEYRGSQNQRILHREEVAAL